MFKVISIKRNCVFRKVCLTGNVVYQRGLVLKYLQFDDTTQPKEIVFHTGLVVSKRNVKTAVKRNFIKRRLRCAIRECLKELPVKPGEFVFIVKSKLAEDNYQEVYYKVKNLLNLVLSRYEKTTKN